MPRWIENTIRVLVYGPFMLLIFGVAIAGFVLWVDGAFDDDSTPTQPGGTSANHGVPIKQQMAMLDVDENGNSVEAIRAGKDQNRAEQASDGNVSSSSGWYRFAEGDIIGCKSREDYDRLASFATSGDREAFNRSFSAHRLRGECRMFDSGDEVFLDDLTFTMRKLRPRGKANAYWVTAKQGMLDPISYPAEERQTHGARGAASSGLPYFEIKPLSEGVTYKLSRETPVMPGRDFAEASASGRPIKRLPPGSMIRIDRLSSHNRQLWYLVDGYYPDGTPLRSTGWVLETALFGQHLISQ